MLMTPQDIVFLQKQTKLTEAKLISLLESDEDLMLEVLSNNTVTEPILNVSFPLFVKMSILKETQDIKKFTPESKEYVSGAITNVYPKVHMMSPYVCDKRRMGESEAQFYLVLTGLFPEYMDRLLQRGAPAPEYYIRIARRAFEHAKRMDIADNIFDWVKILNKIKHKQWHL